MASLRRSKSMPTDGATAKFLYTILKQLDLKSIDWNTVADHLDITNGHAARMRFSRFKQHMEGVPPTPRRPRAHGPSKKNPKFEMRVKGDPKSAIKPENGPAVEPMIGVDMPVKPDPVLKQEPTGDGSELALAVGDRASISRANDIVSEPPLQIGQGHSVALESGIEGLEGSGVVAETLLKAEPDMKMEPCWED